MGRGTNESAAGRHGEDSDVSANRTRRGAPGVREETGGATSMTVAALIEVMTERIVSKFHPLRVILFGSHARGDAEADSDVDLLVVMSGVEDKRKAAIRIRRVLADLPICKDVVVTTPEEIAERGNVIGTVLRPALLEGRVLYERRAD